MSGPALWLARLVGALHVLIAGVELLAPWFPLQRVGFLVEPENEAIVRNVGIYNLFVASLIFWALRRPAERGTVLQLCLGFVVIAGILGAITLGTPTVLALQTIPAAAALWAARQRRA